LPKTFSTRELLARLRAATRRSRMSSKSDSDGEIVVGDLTINPSMRSVNKDGEEVELTALEFDILQYLARSAGRVLNRDQILDEVAGREYDVLDRSIDVHISSLRKKLGDDAKTPRYIRTLRSVGYMFLGQEGD